MISERLGIPAVSTGALLRDEKAKGTKLGLEADALTRHGRMVSDELINEVIWEWLTKSQAKGFILDGYPRTIAQGEEFDRMLAAGKLTLDRVLFLDLSEASIRERILRRMVCKACGNIVNLGLHVEKPEDPCPKCGGELIRRNDDNLEALDQRLEEYREKTAPLVDFYRKRGLLSHIVGEGHPKPVFQQIEEALATRA